MKKKIMQIWIILASIVFGFLFSNANSIGLVISVISGGIIGILLIKFCPKFLFCENVIENIVIIALDLYFVWLSSTFFYNTYVLSPQINKILSFFLSNTVLLLKLISLLMALFCIPFVHIITSNVVRLSTEIVKSIEWKKIWMVKKLDCCFFLKLLGISLANIAVAAICGLLLLTAVYKLPMENIVKNAEESAHIMDKEDTYPSVFSWCTSQLDNFTDAIMLTEASDVTEDTYVNKALMAYRGKIEDKDPKETLVDHFTNNQKYTSNSVYPRYWHGYHIILKPLLEFANYGTIRVINGIIQIILLLTVCLLMKKRGLKYFIIPYIISYLMLMPVALAMSLQFSSCYYGYSIGIILLLILSDECRNRYGWLVFLNIGIFTAFFDFLTYPIVTFGIPSLLLITLSAKDEKERKIRTIIVNGITWGIGFGGMWFSKWILTGIFTDFDIFADAFGAFSGRVSNVAPDGVTRYSILRCIITNYRALFRTPVTIIVFAFALFLILFIYRNDFKKNVMSVMLPYICLAVLPIVWFSFATNHSMIHYFFTNKCCIISVISILFGLTECVVEILHRSSLKEREV